MTLSAQPLQVQCQRRDREIYIIFNAERVKQVLMMGTFTFGYLVYIRILYLSPHYISIKTL